MAKPKGYPATPASFKKGISGNPSGKPKDHKFFRDLLKQRYDKALKVIDRALNDDDLFHAWPAAKFVAECVLGKPTTSENQGDNFTVNFNKLVINGEQRNMDVISKFIPKMIESDDAISH